MRMENQTANGILYYANDWLHFAEHQMYTTVWFPNEDACWNVLLSVGGFYDQINATEGHCDVTGYQRWEHIVRT